MTTIDLYHAVKAAVCGATIDTSAINVTFRDAETVAVSVNVGRPIVIGNVRDRLTRKGLVFAQETRGNLTEFLVTAPADEPRMTSPTPITITWLPVGHTGTDSARHSTKLLLEFSPLRSNPDVVNWAAGELVRRAWLEAGDPNATSRSESEDLTLRFGVDDSGAVVVATGCDGSPESTRALEALDRILGDWEPEAWVEEMIRDMALIVRARPELFA